jgi:hypothetical protein
MLLQLSLTLSSLVLRVRHPCYRTNGRLLTLTVKDVAGKINPELEERDPQGQLPIASLLHGFELTYRRRFGRRDLQQVPQVLLSVQNLSVPVLQAMWQQRH